MNRSNTKITTAFSLLDDPNADLIICCSDTKNTTALSPFDDPNADLIIRSSDGIDFYVHRLLLSLCSSVFEGMFMIPNISEQEESHNNRPCVSVSDDSRRLGCLLSWCDPRCMNAITSLDDIRNTLEMADKYGMDCIIDIVEKTILSPGTRELIEAEPLKLYAIAIRFRLGKLALEAAKMTLRVPLANHPKNCQEFKHISAFSLQHLLDYRDRCITRAQECITQDDLQWATTRSDGSEFVFVDRLHTVKVPHYNIYRMVTSDSHKKEPESLRSRFANGAKWVGWWDRYMDEVCDLLNQTPYGPVAQTPSLLRDTRSIIASGSCKRCKVHGDNELAEFSAILSGKIDEALSQVPFHIEY